MTSSKTSLKDRDILRNGLLPEAYRVQLRAIRDAMRWNTKEQS